jgi:hypothetical protein
MYLRQLRGLAMRLAGWLSKEKRDRELAEEMESHLQMHIDDNLRAGMSEAEARRHALIKLGGIAQTQEAVRRRRGLPLLEDLWQDLRYATRGLLRQPAFTLVAVLTLALGIGANTAIFTVVNSLLLRPLPFSDPGRLVQVWEASANKPADEMPASYPNFADWRDENHAFEQTVAYAGWSFNLISEGEPERIRSAVVSPAFFATLGVRPLAGRVFLPEEDQKGKDSVAVISRRLWERRFNADPEVVGRTINLNGDNFTVVGVVPALAELPGLPEATELWVPVSHGFGFTSRRSHYLNVIARLRPGVTRDQAQADMDAIAEALAARYPDANADRRQASATARAIGRGRPAGAVRAAGRCRRRTSDRVGQRRQHAAGARRRPAEGDCDPHGAGRRPRAARPPAPDRKPVTLPHRRRPRAPAGTLGR